MGKFLQVAIGSCHVLIAIFGWGGLFYQRLSNNLYETVKMISMNLKVLDDNDTHESSESVWYDDRLLLMKGFRPPCWLSYKIHDYFGQKWKHELGHPSLAICKAEYTCNHGYFRSLFWLVPRCKNFKMG